ncbi:phospholipase A [Halomonas stenophila]|uniref:Phospholipase A1 n=1 Tax=Halomonas stenophila TaxID=795312 RepID=A0A7W5EQH0_9GAMM|nr:phospholipase A [Halomonas stenophila]MBB3229416.1 phospholipase A1 [Halomonas stenophila]
MTPSRYRSGLAVALLAAGLAHQALAQEGEAPSAAEREAIRERIQSLEAELEGLRDQLEVAAPDPAPYPLPAAALEEEELEESVAKRRLLEAESDRNPFAITTHRRNYLLPLTYTTSPNHDAFRAINGEVDPDRLEMKFQFSAKFNLMDDLILGNGDLFFGYTQRSWWQAYNADASSPFRETNFEPEVFLDFENDWSLAGWTNIHNRISFNHQSNGRSDPLSRSWNRVIGTSTFINDDWAVSLSPHWRIPEDESQDDNPDIHKYMGYGDVTVARRLFGDQEASLLWRGNPGSGHMGAQLDYSWPLFGKIRGHVQYYHGYGDSLIDYDNSVQRLGVGFSLNPLFSTGTFAP